MPMLYSDQHWELETVQWLSTPLPRGSCIDYVPWIQLHINTPLPRHTRTPSLDKNIQNQSKPFYT